MTAVLAAAIAAPADRRACGSAAIAGLLAWLVVRYVGADIWGGLAIFAVLLSLGSALGAWVGGGIEQPGHLLFVAIVSSLADAWSVGHPSGPSAQIVQHKEALSLLALPWPMLGTADAAPLLGVGDVVFTSLYWSAARRHALATSRTLFAMLCAYALTVFTVIVVARPIPVLPLLGAGMLLAHPAARKPYGQEARRAAWLMAVFAVGLAVWVLRNAM